MTSQAKLALIVEDDQPLQIIYKRMLAKQDYETLSAYDGREALEILKTHAPSLIILDMLLPFVNGVEVLEYLVDNERFQNTHLVMVSSNHEFKAYEKLFHSAEFHLKPILPSNIDRITASINKPLPS